MKAYTDLEQSKKLAEILSIESADMTWVSNGLGKPFTRTIPPREDPEELCRCWSLAALLNIMPYELQDNLYLSLEKEGNEYCCCYEDTNGNISKYTFADNPIDACVVMIERLHEQKLL